MKGFAMRRETTALSNSTFDENGEGDISTGDIDERGCHSPAAGRPLKSMNLSILLGDYCMYVWDGDDACGGCAHGSFVVETGLSVGGEKDVMNFDPPAVSARVFEGLCPKDNCPKAYSASGGAPVNETDASPISEPVSAGDV